jgi:hypothetical protein
MENIFILSFIYMKAFGIKDKNKDTASNFLSMGVPIWVSGRMTTGKDLVLLLIYVVRNT